MKVHIAWPAVFILFAAALLAALIYQNSWAPDYAEAEPLFPVAAEFGQELVKIRKDKELSPGDIRNLLDTERFQTLRPYGMVFPHEPGILVSIRVNKRFSFNIGEDGRPQWEKR